MRSHIIYIFMYIYVTILITELYYNYKILLQLSVTIRLNSLHHYLTKYETLSQRTINADKTFEIIDTVQYDVPHYM